MSSFALSIKIRQKKLLTLTAVAKTPKFLGSMMQALIHKG
jgi:hypothetical protein